MLLAWQRLAELLTAPNDAVKTVVISLFLAWHIRRSVKCGQLDQELGDTHRQAQGVGLQQQVDVDCCWHTRKPAEAIHKQLVFVWQAKVQQQLPC